jgi:mRNA interferase MazF
VAEYAAGDIVLIAFPYTNTGGVKRRPALVLLDTGDDDVVVSRVTSQPAVGPHDAVLDEWQQAGLLLPSVARLHKIATLQRSLAERRLGRLTPGDWSRVLLTLRQVCRAL